MKISTELAKTISELTDRECETLLKIVKDIKNERIENYVYTKAELEERGIKKITPHDRRYCFSVEFTDGKFTIIEFEENDYRFCGAKIVNDVYPEFLRYFYDVEKDW